jgi:hypothetical protein
LKGILSYVQDYSGGGLIRMLLNYDENLGITSPIMYQTGSIGSEAIPGDKMPVVIIIIFCSLKPDGMRREITTLQKQITQLGYRFGPVELKATELYCYEVKAVGERFLLGYRTDEIL